MVLIHPQNDYALLQSLRTISLAVVPQSGASANHYALTPLCTCPSYITRDATRYTTKLMHSARQK